MPEIPVSDVEKKYYLLEIERREARRAIKDIKHALTHVTNTALIAELEDHLNEFSARNAALDADLRRLQPAYDRDHAARMQTADPNRWVMPELEQDQQQ